MFVDDETNRELNYVLNCDINYSAVATLAGIMREILPVVIDRHISCIDKEMDKYKTDSEDIVSEYKKMKEYLIDNKDHILEGLREISKLGHLDTVIFPDTKKPVIRSVIFERNKRRGAKNEQKKKKN